VLRSFISEIYLPREFVDPCEASEVELIGIVPIRDLLVTGKFPIVIKRWRVESPQHIIMLYKKYITI
jgi:hypothetical protein